jgi:hypothetical protein
VGAEFSSEVLSVKTGKITLITYKMFHSIVHSAFAALFFIHMFSLAYFLPLHRHMFIRVELERGCTNFMDHEVANNLKCSMLRCQIHATTAALMFSC